MRIESFKFKFTTTPWKAFGHWGEILVQRDGESLYEHQMWIWSFPRSHCPIGMESSGKDVWRMSHRTSNSTLLVVVKMARKARHESIVEDTMMPWHASSKMPNATSVVSLATYVAPICRHKGKPQEGRKHYHNHREPSGGRSWVSQLVVPNTTYNSSLTRHAQSWLSIRCFQRKLYRDRQSSGVGEGHGWDFYQDKEPVELSLIIVRGDGLALLGRNPLEGSIKAVLLEKT